MFTFLLIQLSKRTSATPPTIFIMEPLPNLEWRTKSPMRKLRFSETAKTGFLDEKLTARQHDLLLFYGPSSFCSYQPLQTEPLLLVAFQALA
jgi:hypothetical protein